MGPRRDAGRPARSPCSGAPRAERARPPARPGRTRAPGRASEGAETASGRPSVPAGPARPDAPQDGRGRPRPPQGALQRVSGAGIEGPGGAEETQGPERLRRDRGRTPPGPGGGDWALASEDAGLGGRPRGRERLRPRGPSVLRAPDGAAGTGGPRAGVEGGRRGRGGDGVPPWELGRRSRATPVRCAAGGVSGLANFDLDRNRPKPSAPLRSGRVCRASRTTCWH